MSCFSNMKVIIGFIIIILSCGIVETPTIALAIEPPKKVEVIDGKTLLKRLYDNQNEMYSVLYENETSLLNYIFEMVSSHSEQYPSINRSIASEKISKSSSGITIEEYPGAVEFEEELSKIERWRANQVQDMIWQKYCTKINYLELSGSEKIDAENYFWKRYALLAKTASLSYGACKLALKSLNVWAILAVCPIVSIEAYEKLDSFVGALFDYYLAIERYNTVYEQISEVEEFYDYKKLDPKKCTIKKNGSVDEKDKIIIELRNKIRKNVMESIIDNDYEKNLKLL